MNGLSGGLEAQEIPGSTLHGKDYGSQAYPVSSTTLPYEGDPL